MNVKLGIQSWIIALLNSLYCVIICQDFDLAKSVDN